MSALLDEEVVVDVDLTLEPQCESYFHFSEWWSHSEGSATHLLRSKCGFGDGLRCAGYVESISRGGKVWCDACNRRERLGRDFWLIPL